MINIVIRCDASNKIGSGHIMRCRNLGRELKTYGARVIFVCRSGKGDLINLIEKEFEVISLSQKVQGPEGSNQLDLKLQQNEEEDAIECASSIRRRQIGKIHWIIVDHYDLGKIWEKKIKEKVDSSREIKLMAVDDLANREHHVNVLLDQNYYGQSTELRYESLVPESCTKLLGPRCTIMGSEYATLHKLIPSRKNLRRIMIFFGGSDEANLTAKTLDILTKKELENYAIDVVIGSGYQYKNQLEYMREKRKSINIYCQIPSLAGIIARADLAIGAGGTTTWERICLKLPTVVIPCAYNQREHSRELNKIGAIELIETNARDQVFDELLISKVTDQHIIERFNSSGFGELVDGRGCQNIVECMLDHT